MRVLTSATAVAAAAALLLVGCSSGDGDSPASPAGDGEISRDQPLQAAGTLALPPFQELDGGEPKGMEIDMLEEVADRLGFPGVEWNTAQFEAVIPGVATHKFDVGATGMTGWAEEGTSVYDTVMERTEQVIYSSPWVFVQGQIASFDPDITSVDDLTEGMTVAVGDGGVYHYWVNENLVPKGVEILGVKTIGQLWTHLEAGLVDAVVDGTTSIALAAESRTDMVVGDTLEGTAAGYCFVLSPDNGELRDEMSDTITEMVDDGTYEEIYRKYFPNGDIPELPTNSFGEAQ